MADQELNVEKFYTDLVRELDWSKVSDRPCVTNPHLITESVINYHKININGNLFEPEIFDVNWVKEWKSEWLHAVDDQIFKKEELQQRGTDCDGIASVPQHPKKMLSAADIDRTYATHRRRVNDSWWENSTLPVLARDPMKSTEIKVIKIEPDLPAIPKIAVATIAVSEVCFMCYETTDDFELTYGQRVICKKCARK